MALQFINNSMHWVFKLFLWELRDADMVVLSFKQIFDWISLVGQIGYALNKFSSGSNLLSFNGI